MSRWLCEYCTFENYPASRKCTMCLASKRPTLITDMSSTPLDQDIYKVASLMANESQNSSNEAILPGDPWGKWQCQVCTYLNSSALSKCSCCQAAKPKSSPRSSINEPLNVKVTNSSADSSRSGSRKNSPKTSPSSPEDAKAFNNDKNRAISAATTGSSGGRMSSTKWSCKACTIGNWQRAQKCFMCGVPRGKSTPPTTVGQSEGTPSSSASDSAIFSSGVIEPVAPSSGSEERRKHHRIPASRRKSSLQASGKSVESLCDDSNSPSLSAVTLSDRNDRNERHDGAERHADRAEQRRNRSEGDEIGPQQTQQSSPKLIQNLRDSDWLFLNACKGVVDGDRRSVEVFLTAGGSPTRQLTPEECQMLNRASAFQAGNTLVHLAIRFKWEDVLATLLSATDILTRSEKRVPSLVSSSVVSEIMRMISTSMRVRKGHFPCLFVLDIATFMLPTDIEDFPMAVRRQLFDELLDHDVQKELEEEEPIINWSHEITQRLGSRLYALWNRTSGDCLMDSVLQASWGVVDKDNVLRRSLAESISEGAEIFYQRWREAESMQAEQLQFSLDESQWRRDWSAILRLASQPGSSLEQFHIFVLAHILRRPVIVYGIKFIKSFRGENIGLARFQGIYLPLLWEPSFCWRVPITLGYTRGHFSALVPFEIDVDANIGAGANVNSNDEHQVVYLPLIDIQGQPLPIHYLALSEIGREDKILRDWMDCCVTDGGLLVAKQKLPKRPLLVRQMLDEWLDRYRRLAQAITPPPPAASCAIPSSDDEATDEE